ncbi:YhgE/Pip domain-containing protein [Adlercreutzia murintestinalis]|uniref:YhgE/Pip domain-containing protein n=1 Tax=Adlercreutzia murintestinalis TaxID=2941325 RepID=UPI00203B1CCC|nr:YhgE/Pip domain-containing protein [Adlercreutzia murintestinalis]
MHNVWTLFKGDMQRLFANVVSCIITIGLVVVPSIFAWYNLIACWDAFDNTGDLKVAVANQDDGYESDLVPLRVNIGDMVVSALRANDQIGWTVTDAEDAVDGTASGKYYAAVVIPAGFSRDMMRFYADEPEHAQITYYVNEKKNAISPKITSTGADTVSEQVNTVFAQTLSEVLLGVAESLSRSAESADVGGQVAALAAHVSAMADDMDRASGVVGMYQDALHTSDALVDDSAELMRSAKDEAQTALGAASDGMQHMQDAGAAAVQAGEKMGQALDAAQESFAAFKEKIESSELSSLLSPEDKERIEALISDAQAGIQSARDDLNTHLKPQLEQLASQAQGLASDANSALSGIATAESDLSSAADAVHGVLGGASAKIGEVQSGLAESSSKLRELSSAITTALAAGDSEALRAILGSDTQALSQALGAPVGIERIAVFPSENFGSAMAPFYTTLGIFIGSLLILVVVKPKVSNRAQGTLRNPKPRQMLIGRFGCMAVISLAQTTLMGLGNLFLLQVQAVHPWLLMLSFWVSGLVFTFIIYVLVLAFANLGKALAVCLLIVQVTGCGGSYPLQILPDFVQWLSPLLPATHAVGAMRAAMFGIWGADYWVQLGQLCLFLIPAALIGFALRKPFERFMKWYVHTVESTKLIG